MPTLDPKTKKKKYERALILSGGGMRGAYQIGVWKFLSELGWKPDLICGSSIGAINAVLLACDFEIEELTELWHKEGSRKIYRIPWWRQIKHLFRPKGFLPLMDTKIAEKVLRKHIGPRIENLRTSQTEVIITAVNVLKSELIFFDNSVIDIEHILASGALPFLFPWQYIDGEPYWDGGVMMNTPLLPAIKREVKEVIIVLLSPVGGNLSLELPRTRVEVIERFFEQMCLASHDSLLTHINWNKQKHTESNIIKSILQPLYLKDMKIITVAPQRRWPMGSILNFSEKQVNTLITEGYTDACEQLAEHFNLDNHKL